MSDRTIVADIADILARRVACGQYSPGDLMPSVRRIADEFAVNRATAQRILDHLELCGFVHARRGRRFIVRDVRASGGLDVYRHLFRLSTDAPDVMADMFADIVAEQQLIVQDAVLCYTDSERSIDPAELNATLDELETLARGDNTDPAALLTTELTLVRSLLTALGHGVQQAVLNSIGEIVLSVPEAVASYYVVSADMHVLVWRALAAVWASESGPTQSQLALFADIFGIYHEKVIARFTELIRPTDTAQRRVAGA